MKWILLFRTRKKLSELNPNASSGIDAAPTDA